MRLYEKYRPTRLEDVVGQPKAVAVIRSAIEGGRLGGSAWWITGPSGSGKTTLARIIAGTIADDWFTREYDSGADLTVSELGELRHDLQLYAGGKGGRAVIVNESHSLRADVLDRLKGILEPVPAHVVWVFTTTAEDEARLFDDHIGAGQLLSRCSFRIKLTNQGLAKAGADYLRRVAMAEGIDGLPESDYIKLMQRPDVRNNLRAAVNVLEAGSLVG